MQINNNELIARVQLHAFSTLNHAGPQKTNLSIDHNIRAAGEAIGPAFQNIVAEQPSILVFADDEPLANFGHPCRYLLYDAANGNPTKQVSARFPPYSQNKPETLMAFHEPIKFVPSTVFHVPPIVRCPIILPDGNRFAILYSGMSDTRHLNDLEFCYRMLVDRYSFNKNNIYVLNYDGTLNTKDGKPGKWPGNNSAYRIQVTGQGDRTHFQKVFADLKGKLKADDLLFIHTNNHGDNFGQGSFLCQYPNWGTYMVNNFCADLKTLPKYKSLIVMMEQCNSGGFNAGVVASSTAASTSIASAAISTQSSYATPDGNWDSFARDWIAAEVGHQPSGAALAFSPDSNHNGTVEAKEAFNYALAVKNPSDSPIYQSSSAAGDNITLGQQYVNYLTWCRLVQPIIAQKFPMPPDPGPEYYEQIARFTPDLQKMLLPHIDKSVTALTPEMTEKTDQMFAAASR